VGFWGKIKRIAYVVISPPDAEGQDVLFDWYSAAEVGEYFNASKDLRTAAAIDDKTYEDLGGENYARHLLNDRSIFARQYFEQRFRCGAEAIEAQEFAEQVQLLAIDPSALDASREIFKPLLQAQQEVASLLFRPNAVALPAMFERLRYLHCLGLVVSLLPVLWPTPAPFLALAAFVLLSLYVQIRSYRSLKIWISKRGALHKLAVTALNIHSSRDRFSEKCLASILRDCPMLERLVESTTAGLFARSSITAEYANLFFLYEYARAMKESRTVQKCLVEFQEIYKAVGRMELQLAIAQRIREGLLVCQPTLSHATRVSCQGLVHPLVSIPSPLDFDNHERSLFVSGQNGVGKSTLLRALGLSLATYRAFGYAHAQDAVLPRVAVWSSMQTDDSIEQGRSLYMSELARAAQLLEASKSARPMFLLDELFRGTNYLESVAASSSVLLALAKQGIVLATSHNVVLATLLEEQFDAVRLVSREDSCLVIEHGVLVDTNGIELMKTYGFDSAIIDRADAVAQWYAAYIAKPESPLSKLLADTVKKSA
jgi:MutS domain V